MLAQDGTITSQWVQWLNSLYVRAGGANSAPLSDTNASISTLTSATSGLNGSLSSVQTDVASLNGEIAALETASGSQSARISTLEGEIAAGLSATIATAKLTSGGTQGSMTFTHGILTAQVQAT